MIHYQQKWVQSLFQVGRLILVQLIQKYIVIMCTRLIL